MEREMRIRQEELIRKAQLASGKLEVSLLDIIVANFGVFQNGEEDGGTDDDYSEDWEGSSASSSSSSSSSSSGSSYSGGWDVTYAMSNGW